MSDLPPLLTDLTLAPLLGVKPRAIAELCRRGRIQGAKVGRRWVIRREAFLAHLERLERARRAPTVDEEDVARLLRGLPPQRRRASPARPGAPPPAARWGGGMPTP